MTLSPATRELSRRESLGESLSLRERCHTAGVTERVIQKLNIRRTQFAPTKISEYPQGSRFPKYINKE